MSGHYPVLLDLKGKRCVVIGGGKVAQRKVTSLVKANAKVTVVSPDLTKSLRQMAERKKIHYINDCFKKKYVKEAFLIIGAANNPEVNHHVFEATSKVNKLVNIVDSPDKCNYIVPSVIKRGDLLISVSTGGKSPALAKKIRKELEKQFGKAYGDFLLLMEELRHKVFTQFQDTKYRNKIFQALVDSEILDLFEKGRKQEAKKKAEKIMSCFSQK
ncbi:MAG: bifunctional precorrin-2 dehydrogenase/sirohydrochlorin ferrochelatase [Nitrospinota bacterium]|nr:bifunctional precorrin-2 dehydrogenase/sirohydrochlorin ferrochelatase [Nitrospinota bacterium]